MRSGITSRACANTVSLSGTAVYRDRRRHDRGDRLTPWLHRLETNRGITFTARDRTSLRVFPVFSPVRSLWGVLEGIEQFHAKTPEVASIPRRHRKSVHPHRRRDPGVLDQRVGLAAPEARPLRAGGRNHRQGAVLTYHSAEPGFWLSRLRHVPLACDPCPGLDYSHRNRGREQPVGGNPADPVNTPPRDLVLLDARSTVPG